MIFHGLNQLQRAFTKRPDMLSPMLFFIDESGHDRKEAPYEVLAGMAIREHDIWNLIQAIRNAELEFFGLHMAKVGLELKGRKLLKRKIIRFAGEGAAIEPNQRRELVRNLLQKGWQRTQGESVEDVKSVELVAYGQAVLAFVKRVFEITARYNSKTFAGIVSLGAPRHADPSFLRKDYAYLLERFYNYLRTLQTEEMGLVVFDELEKAQSRILLDQLEKYFSESEKGYQHSSRIVPEPFFVHSDLTTVVQIADLAAYCLNWGLRLKGMTEPTRIEIEPLAKMVYDMKFVGAWHDEINRQEKPLYGIFYTDDLRPKRERGEATEG
jgi:Protein of unknown function (DUF3800)